MGHAKATNVHDCAHENVGDIG